MTQLADYLDRSHALRTKTLQALLYPAIVASVALMVIVGLMTMWCPRWCRCSSKASRRCRCSPAR
jgi:general secretion pathway protein F